MAEQLNTNTPEQQEEPAIQSVMSAQPKTLSVADVKSKIDTQTPLYSHEYLPNVPKGSSAKGFYGQFKDYGGAAVYSQPPFASSLSQIQKTAYLPEQPSFVESPKSVASPAVEPSVSSVSTVEQQLGDDAPAKENYESQINALFTESDTTSLFQPPNLQQYKDNLIKNLSLEEMAKRFEAIDADLLNTYGIDTGSLTNTFHNIGAKLKEGLEGSYNDAVETVKSINEDLTSFFTDPGPVENTIQFIGDELTELTTHLDNLTDPTKIQESLQYFSNVFLETSLSQMIGHVGLQIGVPAFLSSPFGMLGTVMLMGDREKEDHREGMPVVANFSYTGEDSLIGKSMAELQRDEDLSSFLGFKEVTVNNSTFNVGYTKTKNNQYKVALHPHDKTYMMKNLWDTWSLVGVDDEKLEQALLKALKRDSYLSDTQIKNLEYGLPWVGEELALKNALRKSVEEESITGDSDVAPPPPAEEFIGYPVPEVITEPLPDLTGDEKEAKNKEDFVAGSVKSKVGAPFDLLSRENMNINAPSLFPSGPEVPVSKVTMDVLDPQKLTLADIQVLKNSPNFTKLSDSSKTKIDIQKQKLEADIRTEQRKKAQKEQQRKELEELEEVERIQVIVDENIRLLSQVEIDAAHKSFLDEVGKIEKSKNPYQALQVQLSKLDKAIVQTYQHKEATPEQRQKYSSMLMLIRQKLEEKYSNKFSVKRKKVVYVPKVTEDTSFAEDIPIDYGQDDPRGQHDDTSIAQIQADIDAAQQAVAAEEEAASFTDFMSQEQAGDDADSGAAGDQEGGGFAEGPGGYGYW